MQNQFQFPRLPKNRLEEDRWIGSNISVEIYRKFSESESSYKFEYQNGNVFIVDLCSSPRGQAVAALQYFFGLPNKDHPSPNGGSEISRSKWEFGTKQEGSDNPTGCVGPNLPAFLINIPISDVFYDPPIRAIEYVPLAPPINDGLSK
ncbi:6261_t:CDS:2 [Funneliformis mosseae]|uniref:6261_t:CDS:1 n=1 Tax=Funneliformis mosseae TaxID=27381 RepID=A0A9N9H150_FUNMO|nr:6261_t:CDS:2 [Funneliformis mosseae]